MNSNNIKKLQWICCGDEINIDANEGMKCYELVATDLDNDTTDFPLDLSDVYVMRINSDHLPLWNFPTSDFFGRKFVWLCNMDLFETRQAMVYEDVIHKGGMTDVYFPKQGVKLNDIFQFDVE